MVVKLVVAYTPVNVCRWQTEQIAVEDTLVF